MTVRQGALRAGAAAAAFLAASTASAHPGHGAEGLADGLVHPLLGTDHLLAMVAVGVWSAAAFRDRRAVAPPLVFLGALAGGAALAMQGVVVQHSETGVALSVVLLAALLLLGRRVGIAVGMSLIALAGMLHGYAHGSELAAGGSALGYGLGFMTASAVLHGVGLGLGRRMRDLPTRAWTASATVLGAAGLWLLATRL